MSAPGSERQFVVFGCEACGEKIFADRSQEGRTGTCPVCGEVTPIGGAPGRPEKRRAKRVPLTDAKLGYEARGTAGRPVLPGELSPLVDVSETGVGFLVAGERDRRKLTGFAPPSLKPGETISVTLHIPALFRSRTVKAVVRRVGPHGTKKDLFLVGAEFTGLGEDARKDLRKLVEGRSSTGTRD